MAKIPPRKRKTARSSLRAICKRIGVKLTVRPDKLIYDEATVVDPKTWGRLKR